MSVEPSASKASSSSGSRRKHRSGDGTKKKKSKRLDTPNEPDVAASAVAIPSFGEDFVGFVVSDDEDAEEAPKPAREWDVGKPSRADERERGWRRDHEREDGYANKKERMNASSRRAPWVDDVAWEDCANVAEMLHKEVSSFVDYISPSPLEHETRSFIISIIEKAITQKYPDAKVLPFGSFETKLYLPLGDIDLVVSSDSMLYSDKVTVLHSLANTLRRAGITDKVTIIAKAKVPIIKFVTTHGRFAVDVSINQLNGVSAGHMVNNFIRALPALRALVLVVKSFLAQRSMNEVFTGGLGSYSIVCLAVSFLQQHPKIRRGELDPTKNLGVLVLEFFEFYGLHFNYQEVGISLRDGGTYYNKTRRGWSDYKQPGLLSVEDPADPSNDISRGSYGIMRVRQTLAGAYEIMMASAYQRAENLRARRSGRYTSLRNDNTTREEWSVLASVMGVTQETINHRRLVAEVHAQGTLHRMLGLTPAPSHPEQSGVAEVWRADESDSVRSATPPRRKRKPSRQNPAKDPDEEEEESRYRISKDGAGPPTKRRRVGGPVDGHTVFTTDDEDDDPEASDESDDPDGSFEVGEVKERGGGRKSRRDSAERRSYWLSKGIGPPEDSD